MIFSLIFIPEKKFSYLSADEVAKLKQEDGKFHYYAEDLTNA